MKKPQVTDERYSIRLEFCGLPQQMHVVRFCGDFIALFPNRLEAEMAALKHCIANNRGDWDLMTECESVLWLKHNKRKNLHRIAYGADINDFKGENSDVDAGSYFGSCVRHSLECESKFNRID